MKHPKDDFTARIPVWNSLQMIFMDTDPALCLEEMANACSESAYEIAEIEEILFNEVLPACRFNMFMLPAPEWAGFETSWLIERILKTHRFGHRRPLILRRYANRWWDRLEPMIRDRRAVRDKESFDTDAET
jgi:hypothetical protein